MGDKILSRKMTWLQVCFKHNTEDGLKREEFGIKETGCEDIAIVQVRDNKVHRAVAVYEMMHAVKTVSYLIPLSFQCTFLKGWKAKTLISQTPCSSSSKCNVSSDKHPFCGRFVKTEEGAGFWLLLLFLPASRVINTCSCGITPWAASLVGRAQGTGTGTLFCWCGSSRHNMPLLRTWRSSFLIPESGVSQNSVVPMVVFWLLTFLIVAMQQLPWQAGSGSITVEGWPPGPVGCLLFQSLYKDLCIY